MFMAHGRLLLLLLMSMTPRNSPDTRDRMARISWSCIQEKNHLARMHITPKHRQLGYISMSSDAMDKGMGPCCDRKKPIQQEKASRTKEGCGRLSSSCQFLSKSEVTFWALSSGGKSHISSVCRGFLHHRNGSTLMS